MEHHFRGKISFMRGRIVLECQFLQRNEVAELIFAVLGHAERLTQYDTGQCVEGRWIAVELPFVRSSNSRFNAASKDPCHWKTRPATRLLPKIIGHM